MMPVRRFRSPARICLTSTLLAGLLLAGCSSPQNDGGTALPSPAPSSDASPATAPVSTSSPSPVASHSPSPSAADPAATLPAPEQTTEPADEPVAEPDPSPSTPEPAAAPPENARNTSVDNPDAVSVVVNKHRPLEPLTYTPPDLVPAPVRLATSGEGALLRAEAAAAAGRMFDAAAADGIELTMLSGYRSYNTQIVTYNRWVNTLGSIAAADTSSARPGYSEHQTGLALDIGVASGRCSLNYCFSELPAGTWAAENAHRFGFIVRYKLGHHLTTGFYAEPWHLRYVGAETATAMMTAGIPTLEQFFGLPDAPAYR